MDKSLTHEIIADLKRVAVDLGHAPSREEYHRQKLGKFSEKIIRKVFGSFGVALTAAGMKGAVNEDAVKKQLQTSGEKKYSNEIKYQSYKDQLANRFHEEIMAWVGKYDHGPLDIFDMAVASDFHSQWMDPFCIHVFLDTCFRMQPKVIVLNGDIFDFYQVSQFSKNPRRQMSMQSEINYILKHLFEPLRMVCPNSQIDFLLGNHEFRLFKYLCGESPGLASLDDLKFNRLFRLDDYRINLVAKPSFLTAKKEKDLDNNKIYGEVFNVTHGTIVGTHSAYGELNKWGMSGTSGHVHKLQSHTKTDLYGFKTWVSTPCMCQIVAADEYVADIANWNQGFLTAHIHQKDLVLNPVQIAKGFACVSGVYYKK